MKLPSVTKAIADARATFGRFPFALLDAFIGTVCALLLLDNHQSFESTVVIQILFGAILGFPFLLGLTLTSEKWKWGRAVSLGVQLAGIVLVGLYSMSIPQDLSRAPNIYPFRLLMLTLGMVIFCFAAPYAKHENELGYWQFCKAVCLRIFTAGLFAIVLFGGLAIALAALDYLFGVDIPGKRYGELWVFIVGIFATWFFLAGVPKELDRLEEISDYPKELKIFSQYVLSPLVFIYFIILYAYLGKILIAWDWPKGWVSRLILGFIATGLTSLLLVHPIRDRIENRWMKIASQWFYLVIVPLTVMLFLAVWQRVSDYGITEGRYLGLATVVWLCVLTPYFIFSKKKSIIFLPVSLCVVVFVVSFGPWGMFAVSEKSQVGRLKKLLVDNRVLVDGRLASRHDTLQVETTRQIGSILGYLSEVHGFDAIQPWFSVSLKRDTTGKGNAYKDPETVAKLMGISYSRGRYVSAEETIAFTADNDKALDIGGYDRLLPKQFIHSDVTNREFADNGISYRIGQNLSAMTIAVWHDAKPADSLQIDLKPLVEKLIAEYGKVSSDNIPPEKMAIVAVKDKSMVKVLLSGITIRLHAERSEVISFEADIAYK